MKVLLKVLCLLGCLLVSTFSQMCRGPAMPMCIQQPPPPGSWISRLRQGMDPTSSGEIVLRWDRDRTIQNNAAPYRVSVRERNSMQPFMTRIPTNSFREFVIGNLSRGVEYEAVVCYADAPPSSRLTRNCGFCRTCFTGPGAPEIIETSFEVSEEVSIYTCEASGIPVPNISWTAVDQNGDTISLTDALNGVTIESNTNTLEFIASSELTVLESSRLRMPVCTSVNSIGMAEQEIPESSSSRPTPIITSPQPSQPQRPPPPQRPHRPPPPQRPPRPQRPSLTQGAPVVIEAIKTVLSDKHSFLYHCEARANPVPNITWTAKDLRVNQILTLEESSFSEIRISELKIDGFKVTSELTILQNQNLNTITCTAMNMFGSASRNQFLTNGTVLCNLQTCVHIHN